METGILTDVDMQPSFRTLMQNKAFLLEWMQLYIRPDAEYCFFLNQPLCMGSLLSIALVLHLLPLQAMI